MAETINRVTQDLVDELDVESHAPYLKVWAGLAVLTAIEYFYALWFKDHFLVLVLGLVTLALIKASMVGWYFMHLKFEKRWVYLLIVPACFMAVLLTLMLYPDMAMKPTDEDAPAEEEARVAPASDRSPAIPTIRLVLSSGPAGFDFDRA
jgi:cytochrome c oxidase subunit 4